MDADALIAEAERAPFTGWDFSYLAGRLDGAKPPWSYLSRARTLARAARSVLDLGTGGGEVLASLAGALPPETIAVEAYPPNVAVARARLQPLGIRVVAIGEADLHPVDGQDTAYRLPFPDASFDLVLDRHEAFDPAEVARVLRPGGRFLTQQVGGRHDAELNAALAAPPPPLPDWCLDAAARQVQHAGMEVADGREARVEATFADVGAVVYYLKAIPWQIPDFTTTRYREALRRLHDAMPLTVQSHSFMLEAAK